MLAFNSRKILVSFSSKKNFSKLCHVPLLSNSKNSIVFNSPKISLFAVTNRSFFWGSPTSNPSTSDNKSGITLTEEKLVNSDVIPIDNNIISSIETITGNLPNEAVQELGNYPSHYVMYFVDYVHTLIGIPYWEAIVLVTIMLRVMLLPVAIKTIRNAAAMAAIRPLSQQLQDNMLKDPNRDDPNVKLRYQKEMTELFIKNKINPIHFVMMPLIQIPLFLTFFMALRDMSEFYPGLSSGGILWFHDLTVADPYYILPFLNMLSFLYMIEIGADGMAADDNMNKVKWVLRGVGLMTFPITMAIPQSVFMYWSINNILSILQSHLLKTPQLKKMLAIPDPPKSTPGLRIKSPVENIKSLFKSVTAKPEDNLPKMKLVNGKLVEIIDTSTPPPPPPITFAHKPKVTQNP